MIRARTASAAAAAALAGGLLLSGCGIKPTGVVDSGDAALVTVPDVSGSPVLYFVSPDGDRLLPYPTGSIGDTSHLLVALLAGPNPAARASGMTTALPTLDGINPDTAVIEYSPTDGVTARLPFAVGRLSELGRRQVVCTLASAVVPGSLSQVTLAGTDTTLGPARCEIGR
ncbi:hypothetical protein [Streptomyces sp. NPDC091268]|uniref:hypothetical protein n=1 Tax=Streptomyces sp. NPDC091268 TaxID=3365979 RepID=UPI003816CBF9